MHNPDDPRDSRYGLLRYAGTGNLGDEIQSIAARRFLPRVDRLLDRERLSHPPLLCPRLRMILNGWFMHRPENWPPHPKIEPLLTSFHLSDQLTSYGFSAAEALVVGRNAAWLRSHGPVGARDLWTLELLHLNNIDAWFSGCLTLTLQRPGHIQRENCIVLNDVPEVIQAYLRGIVQPDHLVHTTHSDYETRSTKERFHKAEALLLTYAKARCVITTRLHCAMPCLALGTPVLLLQSDRSSQRFRGLSMLANTSSIEEFLHGRGATFIDSPSSNPDSFLPMRRKLIQQCSKFTGATLRAEDDPPAAAKRETSGKRHRRKGLAVWLTGLSSAGKTTLGREVCRLLTEAGIPNALFDSDVLRSHVSPELGFSVEDRREHLRRMATLAQAEIHDGAVVVVCAVSPTTSVREEVRSMLTGFLEVFVDAPIEVCESRDVQGLYKRYRRREVASIAGIDLPYEAPINPDVHCRTHLETVEISARKITATVIRATAADL